MVAESGSAAKPLVEPQSQTRLHKVACGVSRLRDSGGDSLFVPPIVALLRPAPGGQCAQAVRARPPCHDTVEATP